jgi:hypothetical protein
MKLPQYWLKHWRTRRAIVGYPLYDPPHKKRETTLEEQLIRDNFNYFMQVRLERLAFFQEWLRRHFGTTASIEGDGVRALNDWVNGYGGALIGDDIASSQSSFETYTPDWEGTNAGLNVIIDIAIFIGEYLISKRPRLHWEIYRGPHPGSGEKSGSNKFRPCVGGFPRYWTGRVLPDAFDAIICAHDNATFQYPQPKSRLNFIISNCQTYLALANVPNDSTISISGDYSNEPL